MIEVALLESLPGMGYLVTTHGAAHDSFTDGPLLIPSPLPNQTDRHLALARTYVLAFMEQTLKDQPDAALSETDNPQVTVTVFGR